MIKYELLEPSESALELQAFMEDYRAQIRRLVSIDIARGMNAGLTLDAAIRQHQMNVINQLVCRVLDELHKPPVDAESE